MAGQEFKSSEKSVLKSSRDGVLSQKLATGATERVSKKTADAVLKPEKAVEERLDKIKAAGLSPPEPRKQVCTNLKFGVNNPEKSTDSDDIQQSEQTVSAFIPPVAIRFKPKKVDEKQFGVQAIKRKRKQRIRAENEEVKAAEKEETSDISDEVEVEAPESKMKSDKTRNTLQEYSSAAEKLTEESESGGTLNFEADDGSTADKLIDEKTDKKLRKAEAKDEKKLKQLDKKISADEKKVAKADRKLEKAEKKLPQQTNIRRQRVWNDEKGKVQHKLVFEKELKPTKHSGTVTKGVKGANNAVKTSISGAVHGQLSKYEDDNSALKAAQAAIKQK